MAEQLGLLPELLAADAAAKNRRGYIAAEQQRWPALLRELCDVLKAARARHQGAPDEIQDYLIVTDVAEYLGGNQFYLPSAYFVRLAVRDMRIWDEFDGRNVRDLAARYRMSETHIYEILKRQRRLIRAARRGRM